MRRVPEIEIGLIDDPGVLVRQLPAVRAQPLDQLLGVGRALLELDPDVEILGVLAHDHEVDVVVACAHALIGLAGAHLGVEVESLPQRDVDGAEPLADRRRDRPFQRYAVAPDRVERRLGKRLAAVLVHHVCAGRPDVPLEVDAGRLEHAARRLGELRARAVAGDECHDVCHEPAIVRTNPRRPACTRPHSPASRAEGCASVGVVNDFRPGLEGVIAFETEIAEPDKEGSALRYRGDRHRGARRPLPVRAGVGPARRRELRPGHAEGGADRVAGPEWIGDGRPAGGARDARPEVGPEAARRHRAGAGARRPCAAVGGDALDRRPGGARRGRRPCPSPRSTRARTSPRSS